MSTEDKMTIDERWKYLRTMKKRYIEADRKEQGRLLDEMEAVTGMYRKSLIRLMNGSLERKPRSGQRGRIYGPEVDDALRVIAESLDYICAERLTPNLVWIAKHLAVHGELETSPLQLEELGQISAAIPVMASSLITATLRLYFGQDEKHRFHRELEVKRISNGVSTQVSVRR